MNSGARNGLVLLLGVAIGAGVAVGFYETRGKGVRTIATTGGREVSSGSGSEGAGMGAGTGGAAVAAAPADEVAVLRAKVAELEATLNDPAKLAARQQVMIGGAADADHGMTTDDAWWAKMPRVPAWDEPQQKQIVEQLGKHAGVVVDPGKVECRKRCCRILLTEEQRDKHEDEIFSSVGLLFGHADSYGSADDGSGIITVTSCWKLDATAPVPDRAAERVALLARAAPALKQCGQGVATAIVLEIRLHVDEAGELAKVESNKDALGVPAAVCGEAAIVEAADFAASPVESMVPVDVTLGGP